MIIPILMAGACAVTSVGQTGGIIACSFGTVVQGDSPGFVQHDGLPLERIPCAQAKPSVTIRGKGNTYANNTIVNGDIVVHQVGEVTKCYRAAPRKAQPQAKGSSQ